MVSAHIENELDAWRPITLSRNTHSKRALYREVNDMATWSIREAKRRLGHVKWEYGTAKARSDSKRSGVYLSTGKKSLTKTRTIYPYVDPRILVDFVHKWGFSRQQFQKIRTFSDNAGWLSDSEEEPEQEDD